MAEAVIVTGVKWVNISNSSIISDAAAFPPDTCSPDTSCIHLYLDTSCSSGILVDGYNVSGVNAATPRSAL